MNIKKKLFESLLCLHLCFFTCSAWSANLMVELNQAFPPLVLNNIKSYLGKLPNTNAERTLFIFNAKTKIIKSLQAIGYYRPNISIEAIDQGENTPWRLKINLVLNQPTKILTSNIIISGDAKDDETFKNFINQHDLNGEVLNHGVYEQLKLEIASLGLRYGYFDGKFVEARIAIHQSFDNANIYLHYDSGQQFRLGDVHFSEFELNDAILNQLIPFSYGQAYDIKHLRQFQKQLEQTQYFSDVIITPDNNASNQGYIPINVQINKAKRHRFNFGIGYATDSELRLSAGWETPLINRYGHKQKTKITYSAINPVGQFNYIVPLSHPLNDVFQFEVRLEDDVYGDIESKYWSTQLSRIQNKNELITEYYVRYLQEEWQLINTPFDTEYLLPGITWSKVNRQGDPTNPSSGFSQYYNIEASHTVMGSNTNLIRFHARWKYITSWSKKHRLVARAELGLVEPDDDELDQISPSLRFFTGGDQSIRGFSYQSIASTISTFPDANNNEEELITVGGTRLGVGSLEYQYLFSEKWRAALFVDGGSAFRKNEFKAVYSIGPGIHYISPVGAIRLDLGYSLSKDNPSWRVHFNLGAEF